MGTSPRNTIRGGIAFAGSSALNEAAKREKAAQLCKNLEILNFWESFAEAERKAGPAASHSLRVEALADSLRDFFEKQIKLNEEHGLPTEKLKRHLSSNDTLRQIADDTQKMIKNDKIVFEDIDGLPGLGRSINTIRYNRQSIKYTSKYIGKVDGTAGKLKGIRRQIVDAEEERIPLSIADILDLKESRNVLRQRLEDHKANQSRLERQKEIDISLHPAGVACLDRTVKGLKKGIHKELNALKR